MTKINHGGAFIPVIPLSGSLIGTKREQFNFVTGRQNFLQIKNDQNCSKFRGHFLSTALNSKSEQQITEELLNDLSFEKKDSKNFLDNLSPKAKKFVIFFATVISALLSWVITPTKSKTLSLLVSFVTGSIVYLVLQKINPKNTHGAQKKILEAINQETVESDLTELICTLEKDYSLTSDEMRKELLVVYKRFLMFFLKNSSVDLDEINKLINLKKSLGLSSQEIGECHYECSQEIFKTNLLFLEREDSTETSNIVNKFIFLSDRVLSLDSKKGFQYETSRIRRVLNLSAFEFDETKNKLSEELFIRSIRSIQNSEKIFSADLVEIKKILGISEEKSQSISETIFKEQVRDCVSKENGFDSGSVQNLKNLQTILDISAEEFNLFITQETSMLIQNCIEEELEVLTKEINSEKIENVSKNILGNKEKFLVADSTILSLFMESSRSLITSNVKTILTNIKSKSVSTAVEKINVLLKTIQNLEKVCVIINNGDIPIAQKKISTIVKEVTQNFSSTENQIIYRTFIQTLMKEPVLTQEKESYMKDLQMVLNITENDAAEIYKNVISPIFQESVKLALDENVFTIEKKKSIAELATSMKIQENHVTILKTSLYRQKLQDLISTKSIFSQEDLKNLDLIRNFLDLSFVNVQTIHDTLCEPIFKKSVREAMGASGIVPSNYWEGLEKLRKRLRMTESKSKDIFYGVMKEKLKILFEKAIADDKKKKQPKDESNKDAGEDPTVTKSGTALGIEASNPEGNELLNLVEIYFRNRVFSDKETPLSEQKKESIKGLSGRLETQMKSRAEISFSYPVTLDGLFDKKVLNDLYKQYLVECFSSKLQSEKRRLFSNLNKLGPILGLDYQEIQTIHSNVGVSIYQRYLSQSLSKGYLDNSDTSFLTTIQNTLSMENSVCNQLIKDSKKGVISLAIEKIFASPRINPENVTKIRKMTDQFNVNLTEDLSVSNEQRAKLFRIELDAGIEKGEISNENLDAILKIQNTYGLENTAAKKILFDCVNTRCEGFLLNSIASLRREDDVGVIKELENMLNFGELVPIKFQNNLVSSNEKSKLFSVLQSNYGDSDAEKNKLNLFKSMLDL